MQPSKNKNNKNIQRYKLQQNAKKYAVPAAVVVLVGAVGIFELFASHAESALPAVSLYDAVCSKQVTLSQGPRLTNSKLTELSGIAASRTTDNVYWTHNDSGDSARIFSIDGKTGALLGTFKISGATATDWEDIATGPGPASGQSYIYIADTGNNDASRSTVQIYRLPEPNPKVGGNTVTANGAARLNLRYPGGAKLNTEAVFVDPVTGEIYLIDKSSSRKGQVFKAPANLAANSTTTLTKVADIGYPTGSNTYDKITGADMSPDGSTIAVRSYGNLYIYRKLASDTVPAALTSQGCTAPAVSEPQGEAVAFKRSNQGFVTVSEGKSQPLYNFDQNITTASTTTTATATAAPAPTPATTDSSTGTTTTAASFPANILNLTNWKLTLPIGSSGSPTEITQPKLATYTIDPYFHLNTDKTAVTFRVYHGGVTTSGSSNPRSELREMTNNGTSNASWSSTSGTHTMTVTQRVTHLTVVKPEVVIGQIHDSSDDITTFRLEGTKLYITDGNTTHAYLVDGAYKLGTTFTVKFEVSGGKISYYYNGNKLPFVLSKSFSGAYFKAGNYLQSNPTSAPGESTSAYSEVEISGLVVSHQ